MDYIDSPVGKVRLPAEMREGGFAENTVVAWNGDEVSIHFWTATFDNPHDVQDGAVGEVVAHVFMPRDQFERLPASLTAMIELREEHRPDG